MPSLLHDVQIDWGWPRLAEHERAIARRHEAVLESDRQAHTVETAQRALRAAAAELPGRTLRMRAVDDDRIYTWELVGERHEGGELREGGEFDDDGQFPGELAAEDFHAAGVTIVLTPLAFPESMLALMRARARESLSSLVQTAWQTAAEDLPAGFRTPGGPRRMQSLYLPVDIWADIKDRARQEDRSMSYLVQRAVTAAYALPVE